MANLFVGSDYFISEVSSDSTAYIVHTHLLNAEGEYFETKEYAFAKNSYYANTASVGAITQLAANTRPEYTANSRGTYSSISPESTTGSGTGFIMDLGIYGVDGGALKPYITDGGSGYEIGDFIEFSYTDSQATDLTGPKLRFVVTNTDVWGLEFFPSGLADVDVVANALPLINTFISTNSE